MLLIGRKIVILMSYHVRFSSCISTYGFMVIIDGANQARSPRCLMDFIKFYSCLVFSWWYQGTAKIINYQSNFRQWLHQCKLYKGWVCIILLYDVLVGFLTVFGITDSTLKRGLKLAGYWGQQSCKIYFHSRTTSQDIRGFLGNGFPKSMSCDCYAHTVR